MPPILPHLVNNVFIVLAVLEKVKHWIAHVHDVVRSGARFLVLLTLCHDNL